MGIEKQLDYVKNNINILNQKYDGRYVVISEQLDENAFNSLDEAYRFGITNLGLGNFLLQQFNNTNSQVQIINQTITCL